MYFSKFPILQYPVKDGTSTRFAFVRNLMRRIAMSESLKTDGGVFVEYQLKDGERPEHIAERVYGDPMFHWLVLLVNETLDPYHDWCKSESAMEEYIMKKYGGHSVYVTNNSDEFVYDSAIVSGCSLSQNGVSCEVIDYTPEFCKLTIRGIPPSEGSAVIGLTSGSAINVVVHRVDQSYVAVNHFEVNRPSTDTGASSYFTVDPLTQQNASYSVVGGVIGHEENEYPASGFGLTYSGSGTVELHETYIGKYMGISGAPVNTYAISNFTEETRKNEAKRKIKVLHPRYKNIAVRELESLLRT